MKTSPPDTITIPKALAWQIVNVLEEHVGDFVDAPELGIEFTQERDIIDRLRKQLEAREYTIRDLHAI